MNRQQAIYSPQCLEPVGGPSANLAPEWVFLYPAATLNDGGQLAQERFGQLFACTHTVSKAVYEARDAELPHLDDLFAQCCAAQDDRIYCIHYGPHVSTLARKLKGRRVVYFAHSTGWRIRLPRHVPIVCVSRHTMAYWGRHAPENPLFYLPNVLDAAFRYDRYDYPQRAHDVLIVARKMSRYLMKTLLPKLEQHCRVRVVDSWVPDLAREYRSARVFLYDSAEYWRGRGVSEGFGLPPLEAMASGCTVFSSVNDALADYVLPGVNAYQLGAIGPDYDIQRILDAVKGGGLAYPAALLAQYSVDAIARQLDAMMSDLCAAVAAAPR